MMITRKVLDCIEVEPFRHFRIKMASGQTFDVRHPEMILIGLSSVRIYTASSPGENEKWHDVSLTLMETIEPIESPTKSAP